MQANACQNTHLSWTLRVEGEGHLVWWFMSQSGHLLSPSPRVVARFEWRRGTGILFHRVPI